MGAAARQVLLVEDNSDGKMGVEKALARPPEVAILDIGMPQPDGYEVARRAHRRWAGRPGSSR